MKSYNFCKGCGIQLQSNNPLLNGYAVDTNNILCSRCYKLKHYGEKYNNLETTSQQEILKDLKYKKNVLFIIDIFNIPNTIFNRINEFVKKENLYIIVNKIDLLPKIVKEEKILLWVEKILSSFGIEYNNIFLISSIKNRNIDDFVNFLLNLSAKEMCFIGYSNVGKTSIINKIYSSKNIENYNIISNTIGTTRSKIKTKFQDYFITDYPGFIDYNNYQILLNSKDLNDVISKKEIKVRNYQIYNNSIYKVNNFFYIKILQEKKIDYQFSFSNKLEITRINYSKNEKEIEWEWKEISTKDVKIGNKVDLVISGLGFITFKVYNQKIFISIPKKINFSIIDSIYN